MLKTLKFGGGYWLLGFIYVAFLTLCFDIWFVPEKNLFELREVWLGLVVIPTFLTAVIGVAEVFKTGKSAPIRRSIVAYVILSFVYATFTMIIFDLVLAPDKALIETSEAWVSILIVATVGGFVFGMAKRFDKGTSSSGLKELFERIDRKEADK